MENQQITERVLVGNLQKFSVEDGPGIRTTVFLKGCPLNCRWCHNPELIDPRQQLIQSPNNCIGCGYCIELCHKGAITADKEKGISIQRSRCDLCLLCAENCYAKALRPVARAMTVEEILDIVEQDKSFYDHTGGGMTISGGELLLHGPFVLRLIEESGKKDIQVCLDTSGLGEGQLLLEMAAKGNVTHILYDLKTLDDKIHKAYTGVSNQRILDNLRMLAAQPELRDKLILRMPLIRGINDGDAVIRQTGEFYWELGIRRVNLLPYHDLGISKKRNVDGGRQEAFQQPTEERLTEIQSYFEKDVGLEAEILGRV